jgi:hypothetical protein
MPATTARADLRDGLYAYLVALKAANAAMFAGDIYRVRPGSIVPPGGYVGNLNERISQGSQLRQRIFAPEVVLVQRLISPSETGQAMDDMVDVWIDYVTDNPHMAGGVIESRSVRDVELDYGGTLYSASIVVHELLIEEGRL